MAPSMTRSRPQGVGARHQQVAHPVRQEAETSEAESGLPRRGTRTPNPLLARITNVRRASYTASVSSLLAIGVSLVAVRTDWREATNGAQQGTATAAELSCAQSHQVSNVWAPADTDLAVVPGGDAQPLRVGEEPMDRGSYLAPSRGDRRIRRDLDYVDMARRRVRSVGDDGSSTP